MAKVIDSNCKICGERCGDEYGKCCPFYNFTKDGGSDERPFYGAECFCPQSASKCVTGYNLRSSLGIPFIALFECLFYTPGSWVMHGCPACVIDPNSY